MRLATIMAVAASAVLLCAGAAWTQNAWLALYTDEAGTNCNLLDSGRMLHRVYVIYTGTAPIAGLEFRLEVERGAALNYLGESVSDPSYLTAGRADEGVGVALAACLTPPVHVMSVLYEGLGVSSICGRVRIGPDPRSPHQNGDMIATVTCDFKIAWVDPGHVTTNPDDSCVCEVETRGVPSPTEVSTWGKVKSLYN